MEAGQFSAHSPQAQQFVTDLVGDLELDVALRDPHPVTSPGSMPIAQDEPAQGEVRPQTSPRS